MDEVVIIGRETIAHVQRPRDRECIIMEAPFFIFLIGGEMVGKDGVAVEWVGETFRGQAEGLCYGCGDWREGSPVVEIAVLETSGVATGS